MVKMCHIDYLVSPDLSSTKFHESKYKVFQEMYLDFKKYESIMQE